MMCIIIYGEYSCIVLAPRERFRYTELISAQYYRSQHYLFCCRSASLSAAQSTRCHLFYRPDSGAEENFCNSGLAFTKVEIENVLQLCHGRDWFRSGQPLFIFRIQANLFCVLPMPTFKEFSPPSILMCMYLIRWHSTPFYKCAL